MIFALCAGPGRAEVPESPTGKEVGYVLAMADHPALGEAFQRRIEERLAAMLKTLLGLDAATPRHDSPALKLWLRDHRLEELTPELCWKEGLGQSEKTIVLHAEFDGPAWRLAAVEYDRHFDTVSAVQRATIVQRELVPDVAGRLALRCWSPVGEIISRKDQKTLLVRFPEASRLARIPQWSGLAVGAVLQPIRDLPAAGEIHQHPRTDQFLIVDRITDQGLECSLALDVQDAWFQHLQRPGARYWVRRLVPTETDPLKVQVLFKDTQTPREGCEVSLGRPGSSQTLGHTDAAGSYLLPRTVRGLVTVTVRFGEETVTRTCFVGITPGPLVFRVTSPGDGSASLAELVRLETRLADRTIVLNDYVAKINAAGKVNDVPRMQALIEEAREAARFKELKADVNRLIAMPAAAALKTRAQDLLTAIDKAEQEADFTKFQDSIRTARINVLKQSIAAADRELRWADARKLLEEYVGLNPKDNSARKRFDELTAGLVPKDKPHEEARQAVERNRGLKSIDDLLQRWAELNPALERLLKNQDALWLTTASEEFDGWLKLVNDEAVRIKGVVDSGKPLSQSEEDALKDRASLLQTLGRELKSIVDRTDKLLE